MSCVFCAIVARRGSGDPRLRGRRLPRDPRHPPDRARPHSGAAEGPPRRPHRHAAGNRRRNGDAGQRIAKAARASELKADGNNIVINDGKAAFQSVFHIHLHVAPRQTGDKLSFAKGLVVRRDPDREATGRILRDALAELEH